MARMSFSQFVRSVAMQAGVILGQQGFVPSQVEPMLAKLPKETALAFLRRDYDVGQAMNLMAGRLVSTLRSVSR